MKRKKLSLIIGGVTFALLAIYLLGLTYRFNFLSAYVDIARKKYQIVEYGEPALYEDQEYAIAPKLGFEISRSFGCVTPLVAEHGIIAYNKIMGSYIEKKICKNWKIRLIQKSKELEALDREILRSINQDSLKMGRKDIPKDANLTFLIDSRDSLVYRLSGYSYHGEHEKTMKYFELTVDVKSKTIKTIKNVSTEI